MSLAVEVGVEVSKVRADLLGLMADARTIDDKVKAAIEDVKAAIGDTQRIDEALKEIAHLQVSLKSAILVSLDSLDRIDEQLRKQRP